MVVSAYQLVVIAYYTKTTCSNCYLSVESRQLNYWKWLLTTVVTSHFDQNWLLTTGTQNNYNNDNIVQLGPQLINSGTCRYFTDYAQSQEPFFTDLYSVHSRNLKARAHRAPTWHKSGDITKKCGPTSYNSPLWSRLSPVGLDFIGETL